MSHLVGTVFTEWALACSVICKPNFARGAIKNAVNSIWLDADPGMGAMVYHGIRNCIFQVQACPRPNSWRTDLHQNISAWSLRSTEVRIRIVSSVFPSHSHVKSCCRGNYYPWWSGSELFPRVKCRFRHYPILKTLRDEGPGADGNWNVPSFHNKIPMLM